MLLFVQNVSLLPKVEEVDWAGGVVGEGGAGWKLLSPSWAVQFGGLVNPNTYSEATTKRTSCVTQGKDEGFPLNSPVKY